MAFSDTIAIEEDSVTVQKAEKRIVLVGAYQIPKFSEIKLSDLIVTTETCNASGTSIYRSYAPKKHTHFIKELEIWRDPWTQTIRTLRASGKEEAYTPSVSIRILEMMPSSLETTCCGPRLAVEITNFPKETAWHEKIFEFLIQNGFCLI